MARASVISPYQKFWNVDGLRPLAGGKVEFRINGTSGRIATYVEPDMKVPQRNPYQLDASGRLRGDVRFRGAATLVIMDIDGSVIDIWDDVSCFDDASLFSPWDRNISYGRGGQNVVTGSDGNYYLSRIEDNFNNDPVTNVQSWQLVFFFTLPGTDMEKLASLGSITPLAQMLIFGNGNAWTGDRAAARIPGYLAGLVTAQNDTSPNTTLDIAAGQCTDSANTRLMSIAPTTKRLDATWIPGSGNGGRASGVSLEPSTWYHVFIVRVGNITDVMFDTSPVCANGRANNNVQNWRIIASIQTSSISIITDYFQFGDYFYWNARSSSFSITPSGGGQLVNCATPLGIKTKSHIVIGTIKDSAGEAYMLATSPDQPDTVPGPGNYTQHLRPQSGDFQQFMNLAIIETNQSSQIRVRVTGSIANIFGSPVGFVHPRI